LAIRSLQGIDLGPKWLTGGSYALKRRCLHDHTPTFHFFPLAHSSGFCYRGDEKVDFRREPCDTRSSGLYSRGTRAHLIQVSVNSFHLSPVLIDVNEAQL